jgi:predicted metalloprotease with PDZ domain
VDQSSVDDPLQNRRRTNTRPASENEKRTEKPAAPYLGVIFGTDNRGGATVRKISPKSPAEQAGLQTGDVIESLQGKRVRSSQDVQNILRKMKPGEVIDIAYSRRMSLRTQAALGSEPGATQRTVGYPPDETSGDSREVKSGSGQTSREADENQQRRGRGFRRR